MSLSVSDAAGLPSARLLFGEGRQTLTGVTNDTREPDLKGKLYVAIRGERQDGHAFLEQAADRGAGCVLIEPAGSQQARRLFEIGKLPAAVVVPDTIQALGELARRHRAKLSLKVVAVTGSNGKTSTKDFVAAILSTAYRTESAIRSFNNAIGVPMTLLKMTPDTQIGVIEMGMNHPGELEMLCRIADPDLVAITSIAHAHVGFFRTLRRVALAKSEILTAGRPGIPAFLPADTSFLPLLRRRASRKMISTFGVSAKAMWRVSNVRSDLKSLSFTVTHPLFGARGKTFRCPNFGEHHLTNILLAIGISSQFAVPLKKIRSAVARLSLPRGRGQILRIGPHLLIDDSYNANPESMAAALRRLGTLKRHLDRSGAGVEHDVVLILGDMLELGGQAPLFHSNLGMRAQQMLRPWRILYIGKHAGHLRRGFSRSGGKTDHLVSAATLDDATGHVRQWMNSRKKLLMLTKASHEIRLDKLVDSICQNPY